MGTGKTTLGRALAKEMDLSFCDLDQYISQRYMRTIPQLFATLGESGFREIESRLLREVGEFENVVISSGGSTPLFNDNMDYMCCQGHTIWLDTSVNVLFRRLKVARLSRPLIASKNDEELLTYIQDELVRRNPYYARAEYHISGDCLESPKQISDAVCKVRELPGLTIS